MWNMVSGKIKQLIIENGMKKICLCVVGGILFFGSIVYEYVANNPDIPENAKRIANPPTSKEEDLNEVSNKLAKIVEDVQDLKNMVEARKITNVKEIRVGINNVELSQWRISVVKNNSMSLKENDKVLIINKALASKPSAVFTVSFVSPFEIRESQSPEVYINQDAADFFGIDNAGTIGVFSLSFQKIEQFH